MRQLKEMMDSAREQLEDFPDKVIVFGETVDVTYHYDEDDEGFFAHLAYEMDDLYGEVESDTYGRFSGFRLFVDTRPAEIPVSWCTIS